MKQKALSQYSWVKKILKRKGRITTQEFMQQFPENVTSIFTAKRGLSRIIFRLRHHDNWNIEIVKEKEHWVVRLHRRTYVRKNSEGVHPVVKPEDSIVKAATSKVWDDKKTSRVEMSKEVETQSILRMITELSDDKCIVEYELQIKYEKSLWSMRYDQLRYTDIASFAEVEQMFDVMLCDYWTIRFKENKSLSEIRKWYEAASLLEHWERKYVSIIQAQEAQIKGLQEKMEGLLKREKLRSYQKAEQNDIKESA